MRIKRRQHGSLVSLWAETLLHKLTRVTVKLGYLNFTFLAQHCCQRAANCGERVRFYHSFHPDQTFPKSLKLLLLLCVNLVKRGNKNWKVKTSSGQLALLEWAQPEASCPARGEQYQPHKLLKAKLFISYVLFCLLKKQKENTTKSLSAVFFLLCNIFCNS